MDERTPSEPRRRAHLAAVLTPDETLRHIHYKAACHELRPDLAQRMLELFEENPSLDYATLRATAITHEMPDVVYHTSSLRNRMSISSFGLFAADPCDGKYGLLLMNQPTGVYTSAEPDDLGLWAGNDASWGIWTITGATSLPHRQDPLNPDHFVIECDVPRSMVAFHSVGSRDPGPLQTRKIPA